MIKTEPALKVVHIPAHDGKRLFPITRGCQSDVCRQGHKTIPGHMTVTLKQDGKIEQMTTITYCIYYASNRKHILIKLIDICVLANQ